MSAIKAPPLVAGTIGNVQLAVLLGCSHDYISKHRAEIEAEIGTKALKIKAGELRWVVRDLIAAGVALPADDRKEAS